MFQKCSFCPTLQIRGLLERSHSSHPTTVRAVNERLIRHAQGSPSGSLSPRAIGLCRTFRNSTPLFITAVSTYKRVSMHRDGGGLVNFFVLANSKLTGFTAVSYFFTLIREEPFICHQVFENENPFLPFLASQKPSRNVASGMGVPL